MNYSIILSERALSELAESWGWYEDKQDGLGDKFRLEVDKSLLRIASNPFIGLRRRRIYLEVVVKRFPYLIIYKVDNRERVVFVSSIFHTSRRPGSKYL